MGVWTKKRGSMTGILKIKLVSSPGARRLWSWATLGSPWQTSGLPWCYTWQIYYLSLSPLRCDVYPPIIFPCK